MLIARPLHSNVFRKQCNEHSAAAPASSIEPLRLVACNLSSARDDRPTDDFHDLLNASDVLPRNTRYEFSSHESRGGL